MTKAELMNTIYNCYVENQKMDDMKEGYATYVGISPEKMVEAIWQYKNSKDKGRFENFQNAGLRFDVTKDELLKAIKDEIEKFCSESKGWKIKVKNGENIYYHPDYVRNTNIVWISADIPQWQYDPKTVACLILVDFRKNHPTLFRTDADLQHIAIFGTSTYNDGNFYHKCTAKFKYKF